MVFPLMSVTVVTRFCWTPFHGTVCNQSSVARRNLGDGDHRLANARMPGENRLDFLELDPEAPDLYLVVDPADEPEPATEAVRVVVPGCVAVI